MVENRLKDDETRKVSSGYAYTFGSAAPNYAEPIQKEPERVSQPKQKQIQEGQRVTPLEAALLLVGIVILGYLAVTVLALAGANYSEKLNLIQYQRELAEAQANTIIALQMEEETMSLQSLYVYATEDMGMISSGKVQVLTLEIDPCGYTNDYSDAEAESGKPSFHWF